LHGVAVGDLADRFDPAADWVRELEVHFARVATGERARFIEATSLDAARYAVRFPSRHENLASLLTLARVV
jgi:hypothetical protein